MNKVKIEAAGVEDLPEVLRLVKELAAYEKAPEQVSATVADYTKYFKQGVFDCLLARVDERVVGIALYYRAWSTWRGLMFHLEDLVIESSYRRKGIGQQLFDGFVQKAKEENCFLVKWEVLDWNLPALKFYEKNNAIIEKNWWDGKIFLKKV